MERRVVKGRLGSPRRAALALLLALSSAALPALAEDDASRAAARRLATSGVEAYQHDDYALAVDKLGRAYELLRVPSVGLWLARALVKQGRLVAGSERYTEVGRLPATSGDIAVQTKAKQDAKSELEALAPQIPSVVVRIEGAEPAQVNLLLDGKELPSAVVGEQQPVDPGKHQLEGKRGDEVVRTEVTLGSGETKTATLRFKVPVATATATSPSATPTTLASREPPPANSGEPRSGSVSTRAVLAWSAIGVGAAGVVAGSIAGALAISKKSTLQSSSDCADKVCFRGTMQDDVNSYQTLRTVSSVGFIAGGVLAAAGVVLLVTSPRDEHVARRELWLRVSAGGAMAGGQF